MIAAICARFELRNAIDARNVRRLQTFLTLFNIEFNFFAFVQRTITTVRILNRGKVNEQVFVTGIRGNETIALAVVEPLDGTLLFGHFCGASFLKCHVAEVGGKKKAPCCISVSDQCLTLPTAVPCRKDYREIRILVKWGERVFAKLLFSRPNAGLETVT